MTSNFGKITESKTSARLWQNVIYTRLHFQKTPRCRPLGCTTQISPQWKSGA